MERDDDVIDLGAISVETKGPGGLTGDVGLNEIQVGLSND